MAEIDRTFREGGKGYGHYKQQLAELIKQQKGSSRAADNPIESKPPQTVRDERKAIPARERLPISKPTAEFFIFSRHGIDKRKG